MNDYMKFKNLLAWFVNQLNINNEVFAGNKVTGLGYNPNSSLRKYYADFRNYKDFSLDCTINHKYGNYATTSNYIMLEDTDFNVIPEFGVDKKVISLYTGNHPAEMPIVRKSKSVSIESLGLDDTEPNQVLKDFFDMYTMQILEYKNNTTDVENYPAEELGQILKEKYNNAKKGEQVLAIHLFGIEYGQFITSNNVSVSEIVSIAGLNYPYGAEVRKGMRIGAELRKNNTEEAYIASKEFSGNISDEPEPIGVANHTPYTKGNFLSEVYITTEKYDDITALLNRKKNIILQGAPGVGKSFMAKRLAYSIIGAKDEHRVEMIQFHQNYSYEDFIEGFRPCGNGGFELKKGIFSHFCERARRDESSKYFFVIDEINRGNLSKIMGELMLLLENDKRGEGFAMKLTYSGESFSVPENMYVIGMMNTADRSLAMIDYALRRRFSFVHVEHAFENDKFISDFRMKYHDADTVIDKMLKLNSLIAKELDSGHQIGHSYFCPDKPFSDDDIKGIFKYEIKELLQEYFFDNPNIYEEALKLIKPL